MINVLSHLKLFEISCKLVITETGGSLIYSKRWRWKKLIRFSIMLTIWCLWAVLLNELFGQKYKQQESSNRYICHFVRNKCIENNGLRINEFVTNYSRSEAKSHFFKCFLVVFQCNVAFRKQKCKKSVSPLLISKKA